MNTTVEPLADSPPVDPAALPREWAEWAEEPGHRVVIQEAGRALGILHVAVVGRAEGWLEGLWVQPAARGRGVGRRLVQEAEDLLRGYGVGAVRTAIPARDYAALAVAERAGYARCTEASVLVAQIPAGPIDIPYDAQVAVAARGDEAAIFHLVAASPVVGAWRGLIPLGWRFRELRFELIKGLINDGRVVRTGEAVEGMGAFAVRGTAGVICLLTGPPAHQAALFGAMVEHARAAGANRVALFAPDPTPPPGARAAFAPHEWCPDGLVIVEKTLRGAARKGTPARAEAAVPARRRRGNPDGEPVSRAQGRANPWIS